MNHRRSIAAVGFAGVLALAACGTDDQIAQPAARPVNASQNATAAFQYYYDITHSQPLQPAREPSGDAVVEVPVVVKPAREPSGDADVYVPSIKPAREPSGDADVYVPSIVNHPAAAPLRILNLEDQRVSMQVELAALAEREGLTGLSPAFLQRAEVCSGLSPASASGCTTDELRAALPGNPR
jgi:hypothetical protein